MFQTEHQHDHSQNVCSIRKLNAKCPASMCKHGVVVFNICSWPHHMKVMIYRGMRDERDSDLYQSEFAALVLGKRNCNDTGNDKGNDKGKSAKSKSAKDKPPEEDNENDGPTEPENKKRKGADTKANPNKKTKTELLTMLNR